MMWLEPMEVISISEMESRMTLQFVLGLKWVDPGLTFANLKREKFHNRLSRESKEAIWMPRVSFLRGLRGNRICLTYALFPLQVMFQPTAPLVSTVNDDRNYVEVVRRGGWSNSPEFTTNVHIFDGKENPIEVSITPQLI